MKWTPEEIKVIKNVKLSSAEAAFALNRSLDSVAYKRKNLRIFTDTKKSLPVKKTSVKKDLATHDESFFRRAHADLTKKYTALLKEQNVVERLVSDIVEMAPRSYKPLPLVHKVIRHNSGLPQSAVLQFSDTHIGKNVSPTQTLAFGEYNFATFMARLKYLEESVVSIVKNHVTTGVPELVVAMLGDMLDGTLIHSNEVGQLDPIFSQFYNGAHAIAQFLRNLAPYFPKIRIYDVVGNHCVDAETEILTRRGWLRYTDVVDNDECLGLQKDGKTAVWQPINDLVIEKQIDSMVSIKNRQFNFRGTEHHRFYYWVDGHPMLNEARWSDIKKLPITVPAAAFYAGTGNGVPDNLIELTAAVLTDGMIQADNSNVIVYQNPKKEGWIKAAFEKSGLAFSRRNRTRKPPTEICGRPWLGGPTFEEVSYRLTSEAARCFLATTGIKKGTLPPWVWEMTTEQALRFIQNLLFGDGAGVHEKSPCLYGKSYEWLGEIQALCALHGIRSSISSYQPNNTNPKLQWRLNMVREQGISVGNSATIETTPPTGEKVWCACTETENFFCRREGKSYFTGNTRFQNQHRMPTKNRYSNFDKFLYALVKELVRDIPTISWTLDAQPYQLFEVQDHTFFIAHGDTLRGGDKALGVPNHAMGRLVSSATQLMNKYGRKAPNYYLLGHLHRDIVLPHATGSIMVNGGFPGVDEFGLAEMFTPADPTQKFFFVHPKYGKTATYDISLKYAKPEATAPYTMPAAFPMH